MMADGRDRNALAPADDPVPRRMAVLIADRVAARRADALIFAVTTLILTPVVIVGGAMLILLDLARVKLPEYFEVPDALVAAVLCYLFTMTLVVFWSPGRFSLSRLGFVGYAALTWLAMLGLAYLAGWPGTMAGWLWPPFTFLGLLTLALVGRAYEPRDEYYLGFLGAPWLDVPIDPRDDLDRAHARLGVMVVLPGLLFGAWNDLFSSSWLLRPPTPAECRVAADLLAGLDLADPARIEAVLRREGPRGAGRAARLLVRLKLLYRLKSGPMVSAEARDMIRLAIGT